MLRYDDLRLKILPRDRLPGLRQSARGKEGPIVFTNGCFDILHRGHVYYLARARELGGMLVVGLNSDTSVRRLKGPSRPVNPQDARAEVLAALAFVDHVVIFEEDTPLGLIEALEPDILVKGGDYRVEDIVGYKEVRARGGRVLTIPLLEGFSTSGILQNT